MVVQRLNLPDAATLWSQRRRGLPESYQAVQRHVLAMQHQDSVDQGVPLSLQHHGHATSSHHFNGRCQ
eukprot:1746580-Prorocentrum_lima.AAC.1